MFDKMKQMMELKKQADSLKRELEAMKVEVTDARGIKIVMNGAQALLSIEIDENLLNPANKSRFQMDMIRSVNTAVKKSQQMAAQKMQSMPGLKLPGM